MVLLEALYIFPGRDHLLYDCAAGIRSFYGSCFLPGFVWADHLYDHKESNFWRSDLRMAITRMYYFTDQRCTAVLPWNCRRVSCQDVYGGKKSSNLSCKRGTIAYAAESGQYYRTGL